MPLATFSPGAPPQVRWVGGPGMGGSILMGTGWPPLFCSLDCSQWRDKADAAWHCQLPAGLWAAPGPALHLHPAPTPGECPGCRDLCQRAHRYGGVTAGMSWACLHSGGGFTPSPPAVCRDARGDIVFLVHGTRDSSSSADAIHSLLSNTVSALGRLGPEGTQVGHCPGGMGPRECRWAAVPTAPLHPCR